MRLALAAVLLFSAGAGCGVQAVAPDQPVKTAGKDPIVEMYRVAARLYDAGDYEGSLAVCDSVLRFDPYFAPAVALTGELRYIMGAHQLTLGLLARNRLDQVEGAIEEGRKHLFAGDFVLAERCAQLAMDLASLLPPEMDIELRIVRAQAVQDWARVFRDEEQ